MVYLPTFTIKTNVGKYTIPMDPMGYFHGPVSYRAVGRATCALVRGGWESERWFNACNFYAMKCGRMLLSKWWSFEDLYIYIYIIYIYIIYIYIYIIYIYILYLHANHALGSGIFSGLLCERWWILNDSSWHLPECLFSLREFPVLFPWAEIVYILIWHMFPWTQLLKMSRCDVS